MAGFTFADGLLPPLDPNSTLLDERMARRQRPMLDRMRSARLPLARGRDYPDEKLVGGIERPYVRAVPLRMMLDYHSGRHPILNPLRYEMDRPMNVPERPWQFIAPTAFENVAAPFGQPLDVNTPTVWEVSPETIAQWVSQGQQLFPTHRNLEQSGSMVQQHLRELTGDVWRSHSQADPLKVAAHGMTVSQMLREKGAIAFHDVMDYANRLEGVHGAGISQLSHVTEFLGAGAESIAFRTAAGPVLKISKEAFPATLRPFDLPLLARGEHNGLHWGLQPFAEKVTEAESDLFGERVAAQGLEFVDRGAKQLGLYNGEVRLLDYGAVTAPSLATRRSRSSGGTKIPSAERAYDSGAHGIMSPEDMELLGIKVSPHLPASPMCTVSPVAEASAASTPRGVPIKPRPRVNVRRDPTLPYGRRVPLHRTNPAVTEAVAAVEERAAAKAVVGAATVAEEAATMGAGFGKSLFAALGEMEHKHLAAGGIAGLGLLAGLFLMDKPARRHADQHHGATNRAAIGADRTAEAHGQRAPRQDHQSHVILRMKNGPVNYAALDREAASRLRR